MIQVTDIIRVVADDGTISDKDFRLLFRHIIGEDVGPIPENLRTISNILGYDQAILEQNRERKLEKDRERKRRYNDRRNAENAEERGRTRRTPLPPIPSIPTNPPTPREATGASAAGSVGVSLDDVLSAAREGGIPDDFAREFHEDMSRGKWAYVNRQGNTAKVTPENFASVLNARWKARKDTYTPPPEPPRPKHYTAKDWNLCAERCRNFDARRGCKCGIKVPPDKYPDHPHPPQECPMFAEVKE